MLKKKVLVITYYWPPSGGGGVQRWLKHVKYLPQFGWDPIIFTPENPDFEINDDSLINEVASGVEVIKHPIWEPFSLYRKLFKGKTQQGVVIEKSNPSFKDRAIIWIRANLFIPDPRMFWVKSSVRKLKEVIRDRGVDVVVTTGPPHSMHLIGQNLKESANIKWVADFRDPWSQWDVFDKMEMSTWARNKHLKLEKRVLDIADQVITVSERLRVSIQNLSKKADVQVIYNGVDEYDISLLKSNEKVGKFMILHSGLLNEVRNPANLWSAVVSLCKDMPQLADDLEIVLLGTVSDSILKQVKEDEVLSKCVRYEGYVSHQDLQDYYSKSTMYLMLLNNTDNAKWILPGKMYEYMYYGKPILSLGPIESDAADILNSCAAGTMIEFDDEQGIIDTLRKLYEDWLNDDIVSLRNPEVDNFTRRAQTEKLATLLRKFV